MKYKKNQRDLYLNICFHNCRFRKQSTLVVSYFISYLQCQDYVIKDSQRGKSEPNTF